MARGGFGGPPVLVAYKRGQSERQPAVLGMVTMPMTLDDNAMELGYTALLQSSQFTKGISG